ncbi:MAG: hypothetical protein NVS2B17_22830 [Candidatus Velthaea sp.]
MGHAGRSLTFAALVAASGMLPAHAAGIELGRPAPDFHLRTLDGREVSLASYRGKTLVINVWGSWCPPCRLEQPELVAEAKTDARNVEFLGVDTTETLAVVRAFTAAKGVTYPQAVTAATSGFARDFEIRNYPTTIVIDPRGIVRARHADNLLPRAQLHAYIAAAQHGASAPLVSAEQRKLDAMLDPAKFPFTGDISGIERSVRAADAAIAATDDEMDATMTDAARDHDLIETHEEASALRQRAIAALARVARTAADRALLLRLRGDQFAARGDWSRADAAYATALALDANDLAALQGRAYAASQRGDDKRVARLDQRIALLQPSYASWTAVERIQAKLGHRGASFAALDRATALAQADSAAHLAWTHLYGGRSAAMLGARTRARAEFTQAAAAAVRIPPADPRYAMYLEQAQEARVALDLGSTKKAGISLAPWTGPDLPGSIASTFKYRLAVTGIPGARLTVLAHGLPNGWIGSFCSDRVCSPFRSIVVVPPSGVKIVEFQIVPGEIRAVKLVVRIDAVAGGATLASANAIVPATAVVAPR